MTQAPPEQRSGISRRRLLTEFFKRKIIPSPDSPYHKGSLFTLSRRTFNKGAAATITMGATGGLDSLAESLAKPISSATMNPGEIIAAVNKIFSDYAEISDWFDTNPSNRCLGITQFINPSCSYAIPHAKIWHRQIDPIYEAIIHLPYDGNNPLTDKSRRSIIDELKDGGVTAKDLDKVADVIKKVPIERILTDLFNQWQQNVGTMLNYVRHARQNGQAIFGKLTDEQFGKLTANDANNGFSFIKSESWRDNLQLLEDILNDTRNPKEFSLAEGIKSALQKREEFLGETSQLRTILLNAPAQENNQPNPKKKLEKEEYYLSDDSRTTYERIKQMAKKGKLKDEPRLEKLEKSRIEKAKDAGHWPTR